MIEWSLVTTPLDELKEHPRNPRELSKHDHEHLGRSLDKFGLIDKPIVNRNGIIIGGHQRIKLLKESGVHAVLCWVPDRTLTEEEVDELNIRLNKNTGDWDWDILANDWDMPCLIDWGFREGEFGFLDNDDDVDLDTEGSGGPDNKIKILECPACKAHFEEKQAKVVDDGK